MKIVVILDWLLAGFMGLLLPFSPFVASAIAKDLSYTRSYFKTIAKAARHLHGQVKSRAFSRYLLYGFDAPPNPEKVVGECTHCGNCCLHRSCIYLDWSASGESLCLIYSQPFWKKLACGRYPESRHDIDRYTCPSFNTEPAKERTVEFYVNLKSRKCEPDPFDSRSLEAR
jgi:hypothetical protein